MNTAEFVGGLARRFPRHAEQILAWEPEYRYVLVGLSSEQLEATLRATLVRWTHAVPPKPAEIALQPANRETTGTRHALYDASDPCNGQLFLTRLGWWRRMRVWMGDDEAAAVLKQAQNEDGVYRLYDQWKHGEPFDPKREPPRDDVLQAQAMVEIRANLEAFARKGAVLRGMTHQPSAGMSDKLRHLADEHRAATLEPQPEEARA